MEEKSQQKYLEEKYSQTQNDNHILLKSFVPEAAMLRISSPHYWNRWITTSSINATGKTRKGNNVTVFAHLENYLCEKNNIKESIRTGLKDGAGIIPKQEFYRLIDLNGITDAFNTRRVFVFDTKYLPTYRGEFSLEDALKEHITEAFFGSKTIAKEYLNASLNNSNSKYIGIWNDNVSYKEPYARMLKLGFSPRMGLDCNGILNHLPNYELNNGGEQK
jgi:hypothetical protein